MGCSTGRCQTGPLARWCQGGTPLARYQGVLWLKCSSGAGMPGVLWIRCSTGAVVPEGALTRIVHWPDGAGGALAKVVH
jgi:hypothetical protein